MNLLYKIHFILYCTTIPHRNGVLRNAYKFTSVHKNDCYDLMVVKKGNCNNANKSVLIEPQFFEKLKKSKPLINVFKIHVSNLNR